MDRGILTTQWCNFIHPLIKSILFSVHLTLLKLHLDRGNNSYGRPHCELALPECQHSHLVLRVESAISGGKARIDKNSRYEKDLR